MTDAQIQKKLDQLCKIANELVDEAKARYGEDGQLFYEPESGFHLMAYDGGGDNLERQEGVRFASTDCCRMGAGAW